MANITFSKLVAGDRIRFMAKNTFNGLYEENYGVVESVSADLIMLRGRFEIYRFKGRWNAGSYARNAVKLISVDRK